MRDIVERIAAVNWRYVADEMNKPGYAILPSFLAAKECQELIELFDYEEGYRKTVVMERYRFGSGLYKYWDYPLPHVVHQMREYLCAQLFLQQISGPSKVHVVITAPICAMGSVKYEVENALRWALFFMMPLAKVIKHSDLSDEDLHE